MTEPEFTLKELVGLAEELEKHPLPDTLVCEFAPCLSVWERQLILDRINYHYHGGQAVIVGKR